MATIREYFDTDFKDMRQFSGWTTPGLSDEQRASARIDVLIDFEANAKYLAFFIPANVDVNSYTSGIFSSAEAEQCTIDLVNGNLLSFEVLRAGDSTAASSKTAVFTRRILLYIDASLSPEARGKIVDEGVAKGFFVLIRDREYAVKKSAIEKPLAFISHDTRDKESLVRELAVEMQTMMCPVWYDEFTLKVGDSLRESIEKGLKETKKIVVILSPHFFSNKGWSKSEFDSMYVREIIEKKNVMLPVWHGVSERDVYEYCPRLVDRFGLQSSIGVKKLASLLVNAVKES